MSIKVNLLIAFMPLFFCACQSVTVTSPLPSVDSPELRPAERISFEAGIGPAGSIVISKNAGARPPDIGVGEINPDYNVYGDVGYYPSSRWVVKAGLFGGPFPSGISLKAQYQILGASQDESEIGNQSLSASIEGLVEKNTSSGDQERFGGPGHQGWKGHGNLNSAMASLSYGWRTSKQGLWFLGGGYGAFRTSGKIEQTATDTDPGGDYDIPDRAGNASSVAVGYDFQSGRVINIISKLVYYHINHDHFAMDRGGLEISASFR